MAKHYWLSEEHNAMKSSFIEVTETAYAEAEKAAAVEPKHGNTHCKNFNTTKAAARFKSGKITEEE